MYRQVQKLVSVSTRVRFSALNRYFSNSYIDVKEEVRSALETGKPVVALESTIITHGMPFPENIKCAFEVENTVRNQGAVPATVAIVNGRVKVGLSSEELSLLGDTKASSPIKTSRRDMPYIISNKLNGGTTVCGTLVVASKVDIPVFATGGKGIGIGGVHRNAHETFDISADLVELGRCGIAVVSSGVKSILDISKTLEYLETQGVFVATFGGSKEFPAFYSRISGCEAPYSLKTEEEAARVIKCSRELDMKSGLLIAVPVPESDALAPELINSVIQEALDGVIKHKVNVLGKDITPHLLEAVARITSGKSLKTNIALIKNNAKVAASISVALAALNGKTGIVEANAEGFKRQPVVIGGCNLDCSAHLSASEVKLDGRIYPCRFSYSPGGVGRNICDSLSKLGHVPKFLSAVGDDYQGTILSKSIPLQSSNFLKVLKGRRTAQCIIVFDKRGDCRLLMGDMEVHAEISPKLIQENEVVIKTAPLVVLDANLSVESVEEALKLATKYSIPVVFEPTDVEIADKPFRTPYWKAVKLITPNLNELRHITSTFLENRPNKPISYKSNTVEEAAYLAKQLAGYIENVIVTLGSSGVLVARKALAIDPFLNYQQTKEVHLRHYPCTVVKDFVNVSGAGDCLASGIIAGVLRGLPETQCLSIGFTAAETALYTQSAVPDKIFEQGHQCWNTSAKFETLQL